MNSHSYEKPEVLPDELCREKCVHSGSVNEVNKNMPSLDHLHDLANLFKVLGDSTRIRILRALLISELCVCDLVDVLGMTQSAISHQLRVLRSAKLVKFRKEGKNVYYSLDDEHVNRLMKEGAEHVQESR